MDLAKVSKAIAGVLAGAFVVFLTKQDVIIDPGLHDAFEIVIGAIISGIVVYLAPRNKV